jgi:WD40 repeat protein
LSSLIRKHYHHKQSSPLPKVVFGGEDSWEPTAAASAKAPFYLSFTWSPCGHLLALASEETVEIWDALTLKPLYSLHPKTATRFRSGLTYSPDGHSLAACSKAAIVIWDTQTGGEVSRISCEVTHSGLKLAWSMDGRSICAISESTLRTITVHTFDTVSGSTLFLDTIQTSAHPYVWAHKGSFQVVTTTGDHQGWTINIFEVGPTLTNIKSFPFKSTPIFRTFSASTYRISVSTEKGHKHGATLLIINLQNSEVLLRAPGSYLHPTFSPDANLFAAFT